MGRRQVLLVSQSPRFFSPAETARRLKVSTKALRLYETLGLVKPLRTGTGWRAYGPEQMVRLHQVLALKYLGLPLKRIGAFLGDQLADLDAVLLLREAAFRARMTDDARRLELLVAVRRRLASGETLSVDDLIHLTRETGMTDPIEGHLACVHLRVDDTRRAASGETRRAKQHVPRLEAAECPISGRCERSPWVEPTEFETEQPHVAHSRRWLELAPTSLANAACLAWRRRVSGRASCPCRRAPWPA